MRILYLMLCLIFSVSIANAKEINYQRVQQIENYLNTIKTMKASFVQTASNGNTAEGILFVEKPNKIRMEYAEPTNVLIVGNGDYIVYNDKDLDQITNIDYEDIPASLILANNIKIDGKQIEVSNYYEDAGSTVVTLRYPEKPEIMPITLTFTNSPFALRQWSIVDPQSVEVIVSLYNNETDIALDEDLFKFKKAKSPMKYKGKK